MQSDAVVGAGFNQGFICDDKDLSETRLYKESGF